MRNLPSVIAIGVCRASTTLATYPGWLKGTLGYHGDDGGIFVGSGLAVQTLETFTTGDTVGFGVNFDQSIMFHTKNGRFLGKLSAMAQVSLMFMRKQF